MKKYYSYIIVGISFVLIFFTIAFYYSYTKNVLIKKSDEVEENSSQDDIKNQGLNQVMADTKKNENLDGKTSYELITVDKASGSTSRESLPIPVEYIGLTRERLEEYLNSYLTNPSLIEVNKGLTNVELISFSSDKLVIKKEYDSRISNNKFFVVDEGGYVTVFYQDKKTVFEYTQISVNYLHKDEIAKLKEGFYVENVEKLYSILEGYTS